MTSKGVFELQNSQGVLLLQEKKRMSNINQSSSRNQGERSNFLFSQQQAQT